jgi:hypothetical protein
MMMEYLLVRQTYLPLIFRKVLESQKAEVLSSRIYDKNQQLESTHQTRNLHDREERKDDIANGFRSQFDIVLADVKHKLRATFKKKALIIRVGEELEKVVSSPRSICESIKDALKEETNDKLISVRTIEMYCY